MYIAKMLEGSVIYCDLKHLISLFPSDTLLIPTISKLWAKVPSVIPVPVFPEVLAHFPRAPAGSWITRSTSRTPGSILSPLSERPSAQSWGVQRGVPDLGSLQCCLKPDFITFESQLL